MTPEFTPISTKYVHEYRDLLCHCGGKASDYSFCNLWGWAEHYNLQWKLTNGLCWIQQDYHGKKSLWAPVGDWKNYNWASCSLMDKGQEFIRVPEEVSSYWQEIMPWRVEVEETRGQWDYLYRVEELAHLSGNRFHKKKNLVNQFKKLYEFSYAEMTSDCVESVLEMQAEWTKWREIEDSPSLLAENRAIARVLELWDSIPGLIGGAIHINGEVVAYTVGEQICPGNMVVHFEKGMPSYKGIYQAINNCFANAVYDTGKISFLNREQDLDDEGLRKAKESYNPVDYVKKNTVRILPR